MKKLIHKIAMIGLVLAGPGIALAQVSPVESRERVLLRAESLETVSLPEVQGRFDHVPNPFYAPQGREMETSSTVEIRNIVRATPLSDREILAALSQQIRPTGVMQFGSQVHLVFGEQRVRAGEFIAVRYQNSDYRLEVVTVDSRAYMLRLNEEVISKRIQ